MPEISPGVYRAGHGEPLVLLHGFTGTWHHWRPVLADLVPRFEVIAPTLSGHDGGPPFEHSRALTVPHAADSLEQHLDELDVGTAHLVGNSMGGALALELAKRGRARSVVAFAPGGGWAADNVEGERLARFFARQQRMARATAPQLGRLMRSPLARRFALRDVMRRGELLPRADAIRLVQTSIRCSIVGLVLDALRDGRARLQDLEEVDAPTLVAWPRHDRILPPGRHAARFRTEIPGVEYRELAGVGHVPMWDDPRLVVEMICGFAARHAQEPAAA